MGGYEPIVFACIGGFALLVGIAILALRSPIAACLCFIIGVLNLASVPYWAEQVQTSEKEQRDGDGR